MNKFILKFFVLVFSFFFLFNSSVSAYTCPNYEFKKDILKNTRDADVRVVQEILNLDKRTVIAASGPGSSGQETNLFGKATRESLKRFQALFIEYIGVADGKFNTKTRLVMNSVCKGDFFTGGKSGVYDIATSTPKNTDVIGPIVGVAAVSTTTVDQSFRAYIGVSEAVKNPNLAGIIISGGTASDLRKIASTSYNFLVTPNLDARGQITIQIEAGSIEDLAGNTNENASNEWVIYIVRNGDTSIPVTQVPPTTTTAETAATPSLDTTIPTVQDITSLDTNFPNLDIPSLSNTTSSGECSNVKSVSVNDYTNPCYGKVPMDYSSEQSGSGGGESGGGGGGGIFGILTQLATGLLGSFAAKSAVSAVSKIFAGGTGVINGGCACAGPNMGGPTVMLTSLTGPSGTYAALLNPGSGKFTGFVLPNPATVCGIKIPTSGPKWAAECAALKGIINTPVCCGQFQNTFGIPVFGSLLPPPTFMWGF